MTVGPLNDSWTTKGAIACWYPDPNGTGVSIGYRIMYPNNYDPVTGGDGSGNYPLIIAWGGGLVGITTTGYKTMYATGASSQDNVGHLETYGYNMSQYDPDYANTWFDEAGYEAFVLYPQHHDYTGNRLIADNTDTSLDFTYHANAGYSMYITEELVRDMIAGTLLLYNDSDCVNQHTGLDAIQIDATKVYAMGNSLGGCATFRLMECLRDVLAGAISCAAWWVGDPYTDVYTLDTVETVMVHRNLLKKIINRVSHIPLLICNTTGDADGRTGTGSGMYEAGQGIYQCFDDEIGLANCEVFHCTAGSGAHSSVSYYAAKSKVKYFDPTSQAEQVFSDSREAGFLTGMEWLFAKTKPTTPTDPYPSVTDRIRDYDDEDVVNLATGFSLASKRVDATLDPTKENSYLCMNDEDNYEHRRIYIESVDPLVIRQGDGTQLNITGDTLVANTLRIRPTDLADFSLLKPVQSIIF